MFVEVVLGGAVIVLLLWLAFKKPSGLPPGVWGLPLIGYIPLDKTYIDDRLLEWQKKYGDIYVWRFGTMLQVFVHDYHICRQMFASPDFISRPFLDALQEDGGESLGVIRSNAGVWHSNRRFSLRQLRDLGMGKSRLVSAVQEQALNFQGVIENVVGKPSEIPPEIDRSALNIIWKLIADKQFESGDPIHKDLQQLVIVMDDLFTWGSIADMFWYVKYFLPTPIYRKMFKLDGYKQAMDKFFKYFDDLIEEHQKNLDPNDPKDLMDAYLIEMKEKKDDSEGVRNTDDLKFVLFDMFFAGSDTTTATMQWLILYMAAFPDQQRKMQAEIDEHLDEGVLATLEDKPKMPYTDAVINEVLRMSALANIGVHHLNIKDTILAGYKIPKGTMITSATASIHYDPRYWDKPKCFLPQRWIDSEGKVMFKKDGFLPFGTGKRSCIGESLARMQLFIYTTAIFQKFNVAPPEGMQIDLLPSPDSLFGHDIRSQEVIFTHRK